MVILSSFLGCPPELSLGTAPRRALAVTVIGGDCSVSPSAALLVSPLLQLPVSPGCLVVGVVHRTPDVGSSSVPQFGCRFSGFSARTSNCFPVVKLFCGGPDSIHWSLRPYTRARVSTPPPQTPCASFFVSHGNIHKGHRPCRTARSPHTGACASPVVVCALASRFRRPLRVREDSFAHLRPN